MWFKKMSDIPYDSLRVLRQLTCGIDECQAKKFEKIVEETYICNYNVHEVWKLLSELVK